MGTMSTKDDSQTEAHSFAICSLKVGSMQTTTCKICTSEFSERINGCEEDEDAIQTEQYLANTFTRVKILDSICNRLDSKKSFWVDQNLLQFNKRRLDTTGSCLDYS